MSGEADGNVRKDNQANAFGEGRAQGKSPAAEGGKRATYGARKCGSSGASPRTASHPTRTSQFRLTTSEIRNPDGSVVFQLDNVEVPEFWSQVASDVLAQKYFRKAGVPARLKKVEEETVPSFLWRSVADEDALAALPEKPSASSASIPSKQVFDRLAGTWTYWGWKGGYFDTEDDAQAFFDEHRYMLATQMCAPNSPQWFNTGLHWAYGIDGPEPGPLLCRLTNRQADQVEVGLRASAAACLLHPVDQRRPRQRGRHHGSVGARGAPVQIRLRHRLELLASCAAKAKSSPAAASRPA